MYEWILAFNLELSSAAAQGWHSDFIGKQNYIIHSNSIIKVDIVYVVYTRWCKVDLDLCISKPCSSRNDMNLGQPQNVYKKIEIKEFNSLIVFYVHYMIIR